VPHDRFDRSRNQDDPRRILGVPEEAGMDEITQAFRRKVLLTHPDAAGPESRDAEKFRRIVLAYKTLRDELRRHVSSASGGNTAQTGEECTGAPSDGAYVFLEIPPSEALKGGSVTIRLSEKEEFCPRCDGSGQIPDEISAPCGVCGGHGTRDVPWGDRHLRIVCEHCSGTGMENHIPCPDCRGQGRIISSRLIHVSIPPGIRDGDVLTLPGQGPRRGARGERDPLHAVARVDLPPGWRIQGADVHAPLEMDVWTALVGGCVGIQTMDGTVPAQIPPGTVAGDTHRLHGRGWVDKNGARGDHVAEISIKMPQQPPGGLASSLVHILKVVWPAEAAKTALPGPESGKRK